MTMQLFKFQTNRLSFRPTALKTLFRPCSQNTHLKATEKALEENFWVQNTKHSYNSFSTARLRPRFNTATSLQSQGKKARFSARCHRLFPGPWLSFAVTGSFLDSLWFHCISCRIAGHSRCALQAFWLFFFFLSCQYLSHLFPESAAAPKSASVTFCFEVFRMCLLGKHLPCLPAQTLTDFPSVPFHFLLCWDLPPRTKLSITSWSAPLPISIPILVVLDLCQRWLLPQDLSSGKHWGAKLRCHPLHPSLLSNSCGSTERPFFSSQQGTSLARWGKSSPMDWRAAVPKQMVQHPWPSQPYGKQGLPRCTETLGKPNIQAANWIFQEDKKTAPRKVNWINKAGGFESRTLLWNAWGWQLHLTPKSK